jgi:uncharacterized protein (TIGR00290 family)
MDEPVVEHPQMAEYGVPEDLDEVALGTVTRAWMSWSSGKDSALALHRARHDLGLDVDTLLVTVNAEADRVAMHAVRRSLVEEQARRLGMRLHVVELPWPCPNDVYEARMAAAVATARDAGVERMVFGDLFLEDIRAYRDANLADTGISAVYPLWQHDTTALARVMVSSGVRALITCVDSSALPADFVGRAFDADLLAALPAHVDPCGERGEFHTFVWDAPGFESPIAVEVGERVERDGFVWCDVVPAAP